MNRFFIYRSWKTRMWYEWAMLKPFFNRRYSTFQKLLFLIFIVGKHDKKKNPIISKRSSLLVAKMDTYWYLYKNWLTQFSTKKNIEILGVTRWNNIFFENLFQYKDLWWFEASRCPGAADRRRREPPWWMSPISRYLFSGVYTTDSDSLLLKLRRLCTVKIIEWRLASIFVTVKSIIV